MCNVIFNFNISVARACIFLWWIETGLSFFNKSQNEDDLWPHVILNALSCKEFILLLKPLLWNIQIKGQYPNWDVTNVFVTVFLFLRHIYEPTIANTLGFWLVFFFFLRLLMWSSKESFESNIMSSSSVLFSDMMVLSSILTLALSFPENSTWLFPLFIFMM